MQIVGITGRKQSGKTTAAEYLALKLVGHYNCSFADPIKRMLRILGLDEEQLNGSAKEACDLRYGKSPREMMQTLGTEWGRNTIDPDIWLRALSHQIGDSKALIHDVRFGNEAEYVRERGVLIHVVRYLGPGDDDHESEGGVPWKEGDILVENYGGKEELFKELDNVVKQLRALP